jgi:hypothetical protein
MSSFTGVIVTEHPFKVKDPKAFVEALSQVGVADGTGKVEGLFYDRERDGSFWIGGYAPSLFVDDEDESGNYVEVDVAEIIQEHILPGEYADIRCVGNENLRYVIGCALLITSKGITEHTLSGIVEEWRKARVTKQHLEGD